MKRIVNFREIFALKADDSVCLLVRSDSSKVEANTFRVFPKESLRFLNRRLQLTFTKTLKLQNVRFVCRSPKRWCSCLVVTSSVVHLARHNYKRVRFVENPSKVPFSKPNFWIKCTDSLIRLSLFWWYSYCLANLHTVPASCHRSLLRDKLKGCHVLLV